jgi:hypothetical protein
MEVKMSEMKQTLEDEARALHAALYAILRWDIENVLPNRLFQQAKSALRPRFAPATVNADLLEACEAALPYLRAHIALTFSEGPGDRIALDMCEEAIAKAKGERS